MRNVLIFLIVFQLIVAPAYAASPTRSSLCLLVLSEVSRTSHLLAKSSQTYTLNTLGAFRTHVLSSEETQGDIPVGFVSSQSIRPGMTRGQVISRVSGIEQFARQHESESTGRKNITKSIVIEGRENIRGFLQEFGHNYSTLASKSFKKALQLYKKQLFVNAFFLLHVNFEKLMSLDPLVVTALFGVGLIEILWGMDHFLQRPFFKDRHIDRDVNDMLQMLEGSQDEYWAILSRNSMVEESKLRFLQQHQDDERITDSVLAQDLFESAPIIARAMGLRGTQSLWVGIDFYLEKRKDLEEPELHIIFRSYEKRPLFPSRAKKEQVDISNGVPVFAPSPVPVPIPVK